MKFSTNQWCAVFALDAIFKLVIISILEANPISYLIELFWSGFYLSLLICANAYVRTCDLTVRKATVVVLVAANTVFLGVKAFLEVYYPIIGRATMCTDNKCKWVDGAITWFGLQTMFGELLVRLLLNALPFLIVVVLSLRRGAQVRRG